MTAVVHLFSFSEYRLTPVTCNGCPVPADLSLPILDSALAKLDGNEVPWPEIIVGIVALLAQQPDWPDRAAYARIALAFDSNIVSGLIADASELLARQDWRGARPYLRAALAIDPDSLAGLYLMGATCYQRARQATTDLDPGNGDPLLRTTLLHEADRALTHHAELSEPDALARFVHGLVLADLNRSADAVRQLEEACELGLSDDARDTAEAIIERLGSPATAPGRPANPA